MSLLENQDMLNNSQLENSAIDASSQNNGSFGAIRRQISQSNLKKVLNEEGSGEVMMTTLN